MLLKICGKTPIQLCLDAFSGLVDEIVIAVSPATESEAFTSSRNIGLPVTIVHGGKRRQDSVCNALHATDADIVAIHDCARCLVTPDTIRRSIATAIEHGSGVASTPVTDTLRYKCDGAIVDRDALLIAHTPQTFDRLRIIDAYERISSDYTDDAAVFRAAGNELHYSESSSTNLKLTVESDIPLFEAIASNLPKPAPRESIKQRIGFGEDTHRLTTGRKLILGGVEVPNDLGLLGHSDADVLTHAIIDAILGACALGDIGQHFPDSSPKYAGISSLLLAKEIAQRIAALGFRLENIDSTIVAQKPKLAGFRDRMRSNLAEAFGLDVTQVSVKFTTPEHTGPEGNLECITARACALVSNFS